MKIAMGMSGGVDSSVAALLLKQQGLDVFGLFMLNWEEEDGEGKCSAQADFEDVKLCCQKIGIPYYTVNFSKAYYDKVFSYFLQEYQKGRTPNPDVLCNREIKFGSFLDFAKSLNAAFAATGHYARVINNNGTYELHKARDLQKDQSYFLHQLNQDQLAHAMFPLGDMQKDEVRQIAKKFQLSTFDKKDSTGICFIGERNFKKFLQGFLPAQKGAIVDTNGKQLGEHDGLMFYTLGQRRGLGIGGQQGQNGNRWFVIQKNLHTNQLVVSNGEDDMLYTNELVAHKFHWISGSAPLAPFECHAKFRYRQPDQKVTVFPEPKHVKIVFHSPQRAITSGQYAVLYQDTLCLGGGEIV